ncbi:GTPase Era [Helicobacter zhangjianzhongii]|uniref:GTPase Era n=1 Tax=Helicobacter zhangjianzhongii TaxID=2974574 RepID=A0ACC6FRL5_9HELI|nr:MULTISPECIES: GTPase Era [unclassified Helicobacter]MDL0080135.1 GTPase Era [Helicobacter sp. CPD2-1]MDL0081924.1 GTPase Era [Helicobacter sp. XJK30-2]
MDSRSKAILVSLRGSEATQALHKQKVDSRFKAMDRHALQSKARDDRKSNKSKQNTKDSRKNTQILKTPQNENTESVFDTNAAGGRKMDSTQNAQNLNNPQAAKPTPAPSPSDSKIEAQNLNESAKDSRICDEKSGLFKRVQGRILGVCNRSARAEIADLSRKAESTSKAESPLTPKTQKAGFVGVVGRPNTGKSSLLNLLVGEHLALISHKANATRNTMRFIVPYTTKDRTACQMIFVDTPGLHKREKLLNQFMLEAALKTMRDCDVCVFMASVFDDTKQYEEFLELFYANDSHKKHILVINKTDMLPPKKLLGVLEKYAKFSDKFSALIPISVKKSHNITELLESIAKLLPDSPPLFDEDEMTTHTMREIAKEMVRQSIFENLSDEIPYESDVIVTEFFYKPRTRDLVLGKHSADFGDSRVVITDKVTPTLESPKNSKSPTAKRSFFRKQGIPLAARRCFFRKQATAVQGGGTQAGFFRNPRILKEDYLGKCEKSAENKNQPQSKKVDSRGNALLSSLRADLSAWQSTQKSTTTLESTFATTNAPMHIVHIYANIYVLKPSQKRIIIGQNGSTIKRIGAAARESIERILGERVFLRLQVIVDKQWAKNANNLKSFGYNLQLQQSK